MLYPAHIWGGCCYVVLGQGGTQITPDCCSKVGLGSNTNAWLQPQLPLSSCKSMDLPAQPCSKAYHSHTSQPSPHLPVSELHQHYLPFSGVPHQKVFMALSWYSRAALETCASPNGTRIPHVPGLPCPKCVCKAAILRSLSWEFIPLNSKELTS